MEFFLFFFTQIANGMKDIKLGDVSPTRDFSYVKDTCRGFLAIAENNQTIGETINIGSNFEISIADTLNIIKELRPDNITFPKNALIEVSSFCNHACVFCGNPQMSRKTGRLDINIFNPTFSYISYSRWYIIRYPIKIGA